MIVVTISSGEAVNAIGMPRNVVPLHSPMLRDEALVKGNNERLYALVRAHTGSISRTEKTTARLDG